MVPADIEEFGQGVAVRLARVLGDALVGAYFVGSVALGGYVPGDSDVDVLALCEEAVLGEAKEAIASNLLDETTRCPARGLEFTLYRRQVATSVSRGADFEVNVCGGPRMERLVRWSPDHVGQGLGQRPGSLPWEFYTVLADDRADLEGATDVTLSAVAGDGSCCVSDGADGTNCC